MKFSHKDIKIEFTKGKGPGGQHKNKRETAVRATHIPTGIVVFIDGRNQHQNRRHAIQLLRKEVKEHEKKRLAKCKKEHRDEKIHNMRTVRTYDFTTKIVTDHRTEKTATIKQVLRKGKLDLLR